MSTSRSAGLTLQAQTSQQETTALVKHSLRWSLLGSTVLRPGVGAYVHTHALVSDTNPASNLQFDMNSAPKKQKMFSAWTFGLALCWVNSPSHCQHAPKPRGKPGRRVPVSRCLNLLLTSRGISWGHCVLIWVALQFIQHPGQM